jgi:hypothetical protein
MPVRRDEAEIKERILSTITLLKANPRRGIQRKKLSNGEIRTYTRTDYFIRLPARMRGGDNRPLAVMTWENLNRLITIKKIYGLSDDDLILILLELFAESS